MNILNKVTFRILKLNKTRTWVTVIGIVLSAAMFTAVTTCVSSLQNFLLRTVISTRGGWHGAQYGVEAEDLTALENNEEVRDHTVLEQVGYALIGSKNAYKPYLMIQGFDEKLTEILPVHLIEGRLPQNGGEILLPAHLATNGQVRYAVGDTLTLEVGDRLMENWEMDQHNPYDEKEVFRPRTTRTYTVVGFYRRPTFEEYTAPGYTALTCGTGETETADVYICMKNPRKIYALLDGSARANEVNTNLLRYTGMSNEGSYNQVILSMAAILMGIISFGSVSLIYNAFSISVGERTKQFGILKTVGATRPQLLGSVLYEALILSAVGIPLGVGSGVLGIGVTLLCTRGWFDSLLGSDGVTLQLYVSVPYLLLAAVICMVTVLISAWIPARRAIRMDPIASVRQNADINIRPNKVRTPRLIYKLFGFEGMLADKNFKRNRKRYRATVASLFVSVVLFISTGSFCAYMTNAVDRVVYVGNYDLAYYLTEGNRPPMSLEEFRQTLEDLDQVENVVYYNTSYFELQMADRELSEEYLARRDGETELPAYLIFLDDDAFRRWAEEQTGRSADRYFKEPMAIAVDGITRWDPEKNVYHTFNYLKDGEADYSFRYVPDEIDGYFCVDSREEGDTVIYVYQNDAGERREYRREDTPLIQNAGIGTVVAENPWGGEKERLTLVYPLSMYFEVLPGEELPSTWNFQMSAVRRSADAAAQVAAVIEPMGLTEDYLSDLVAGNESDRALVGVINVFSYGFIILISLIALANVFNTVSTNIVLRRREFAMLRSVGMTEKGLNKMMNYECILYGVKGLGWGLPVAVGVTWLIYRAVSAGVVTAFYLPWYSVAIAVGSVFVVVFCTMLYAMRRIKKEDPIESLKLENI